MNENGSLSPSPKIYPTAVSDSFSRSTLSSQSQSFLHENPVSPLVDADSLFGVEN
jgi:hypothetical protein